MASTASTANDGTASRARSVGTGDFQATQDQVSRDRKAPLVARLKQNWDLEPDQVTSNAPDDWSRHSLEWLVRLSEQCSRDEGISAIEHALSERLASRGHHARLRRHVQIQDVRAALTSVEAATNLDQGPSNQEDAGSLRTSFQGSRTPNQGRKRVDRRSRSPRVSGPTSDVGSLELGMAHPGQQGTSISKNQPVRSIERGATHWEQDTTLWDNVTQNRLAAEEEAESNAETHDSEVETFQLPSSANILRRCARFLRADNDDFLSSYYFRLENHAQLDWFERQRMKIPNLLDYLNQAECIGMVQGESRMYMQEMIPPIASDYEELVEVENMMHSLLQQVIREDPLNYAVTAAIQPDRTWELNSLPCAAQIARIESEDRLVEGSFARSAFGPDKTVRPYNSHHFAWKTRRMDPTQTETVFLRIKTQLLTAEQMSTNLGLGGFAICRMNEECQIPDFYQTISQRRKNPASMAFPHCSAIGAALAGSQSWKSPQVHYELSQLFGDDETAAADYVESVRKRILVQWKVYFAEVTRRHQSMKNTK
jgi:hypothetical protein